ncbi:hypothetical protein DERF_002654 [Dermatophagoides farinae]|uniref:Uncharacterized protein n=1 Tax=Dermatophagoides farinae TaxID=6954 RepID=A0A922IDJ2_DERFA|nr:hypothetical protein DERF_002654 [Dermatophagoides farinae]
MWGGSKQQTTDKKLFASSGCLGFSSIQLFSVFIIGKLLPTQSSSKMEPLLPSRVSNIDPKTIESD